MFKFALCPDVSHPDTLSVPRLVRWDLFMLPAHDRGSDLLTKPEAYVPVCTCTITHTHKGISFKNQAQQYNLKSIKHKQNCTQTHTSRRVTQSLRHIRPSVFLCPVSFCQA